jgi:hypothetical protein
MEEKNSNLTSKILSPDQFHSSNASPQSISVIKDHIRISGTTHKIVLKDSSPKDRSLVKTDSSSSSYNERLDTRTRPITSISRITQLQNAELIAE